jgi:Tfp pilus assembly protein PilX
MLEYFNINGYAVYRITAVGFGANDSTRAYLQTSVKAKPV